jgi:hypothetical protein
MQAQFGRPGSGMPEEEPAVPIEPAVAAARTKYVKAKIEIVKGLKADGLTQPEVQQHPEVKDFAEKYPALFKMLFKIDINNEASLRTMLAMLERMGTGDMTQDQASTVVGQRLYDTFIKPKIGEDVPK